MDIAALSMAMSQSKIMQEASLSVVKLAMDTAKGNSTAMTDMVGQNNATLQSVQSHLGGSLDIKI